MSDDRFECEVGENARQHHALSWIGNYACLTEKSKAFFKKRFCAAGACNKCSTCAQIDNDQHHAFERITPEKQIYTIDQIDYIRQRLSLKLDAGESFFIVIDRAEALSPATANKLLKPLEEPPAGYRFLLFAESAEMLLPTIVSRCVIADFTHETNNALNWERDNFKRLLCASQQTHLLSLYQQYEKVLLDERQTVFFLSDLLTELISEYKKSCAKQGFERDRDLVARKIDLVEETMSCLPMPGSCKIFWRTFLLRVSGINAQAPLNNVANKTVN